MKILKTINNNIVSAYDNDGKEVIIMGRGIGFKAKSGAEISESEIEKVFIMDSQNETDKLKELLKSLPIAHIKLTDDVIAYAKKILGKKLNQNIYITLTDHLNFAIERFKQGLTFQNALFLEVRRFYSQEFTVGLYALELMQKELGLSLPVDEAASVALHIVNAEYDTSLGETIKTTQLIEAILEIVKRQLKIDFDEHNIYYERFITHLKYLAYFIQRRESPTSNDEDFISMILRLYPKETECAKRICGYILDQYNYTVSDEEMAYLTIHIRRIAN